METLTVQIKNEEAYKLLQDLVESNFIKIISKQEPESLVFPGEALSEQEFKSWIENRENEKTVSLKDAKARWENKRKQILNSEE